MLKALERQGHRVVDPFWESDEIVEAQLVITGAPDGWEETQTPGLLTLSECEADAVMLETHDAAGRRWRHLHVGLPLPYDEELAEGIACEFLGAGGTWIVGPRLHPLDDSRAMIGFHVCLDDPSAVPPLGLQAPPHGSDQESSQQFATRNGTGVTIN